MTARRAAAALVAAVLLAGAAPGAAADRSRRPLGVPPAPDPAALPTAAEAAAQPYRAPNQVGDPAQEQQCVAPLGRPIEAVPPGQARMRVGEAQRFATGAGQTVAVVDSGVTPHPRLAGRLDDGGDLVLGTTGLQDCDGHGTLVAGIIAAAPDPATGFVGVAPGARVLSIRQASTVHRIRVLDAATGREDDRGTGDTTSMARAVRRAVDTPGVSVVNISEAACIPAVEDQVDGPDLHAAVRDALDRDVVVVVAAANASAACPPNEPGAPITTIATPGWFDEEVLTVAATGADGEPAPFSVQGPWVDVAAPGTDVVSLDPAGPGLTDRAPGPDGRAGPVAGTSFAAPFVAGVAALVRERFPDLTARQVVERIERTAQHTAGPGGRDDALGHGVVDPVAALTAVLPEERGVAPAPPEPARLQGVALPAPADPRPRTVALVGAGSALGLLALALLVAGTVRRARRGPVNPR